MSEHTPGPWTVEVVDSGFRINSEESDASEMCVAEVVLEEDADLIAAAPELLAACKAFVVLFRNSDMRPEDECHEVFSACRIAIAKAETGRHQG